METSPELNYLDSARKLFGYYRELGDKALAQIDDEHIHWQPSPESNSVAIIVKHLNGNMRSRFTDFLTADGEKPWRDREAEFENDYANKEELLAAWNEGWECFFDAVNPLTDRDLDKIVYIRNEGHTVLEALSRQLAHYPYHIGQLVYLCRLLAGEKWQSLSIPKGGSRAFNNEKFAQEKQRKFFAEKR
ncbi:MAG: DUF1572 domain-containing protein [Saprospiraceae bacterium]|nr:DUF1572 domain-containing protein [Saprospiraceae bacterium]